MQADCSLSHWPLLQSYPVCSVQRLLSSCSQGKGQHFRGSCPEAAGEFATFSLPSNHCPLKSHAVLVLTLTHTLFAQATRVPAHLMMGMGPSPAWMMLSFAPNQPWTEAPDWSESWCSLSIEFCYFVMHIELQSWKHVVLSGKHRRCHAISCLLCVFCYLCHAHWTCDVKYCFAAVACKTMLQQMCLMNLRIAKALGLCMYSEEV